MRAKTLAVAMIVCAMLSVVGCSEPPEHTHSWDEGTVTVQPTCTQDGKKTYTCADCKEQREEVIDATGHAFSAPKKENEVNGTCLVESSYDNVTYCLICHTELDKEHVTGELGEHKWNDGVVESNRTFTADGKVVYTCSLCADTREDILPAGAYFAEDFNLTDGGAWSYGKANYDWGNEDFEFIKATSNGTDAWIAEGVEIKAGWINVSEMTTIAYTLPRGGTLNAKLSFKGSTDLTKLALRVGVKNSEGVKYSNPTFHAPEGNTLSLNSSYEVKAGDTIYFMFSNEAWDVEGAYPNGDLNITLTLEKPLADFANDFTLTDGGAWSYGKIDYDWGSDDFEFIKATSNGTDAWKADGVEIKAGWINAAQMAAVAYTAERDMAVNVKLNFVGGTDLTKLALRVGVKNSEGVKYSNPTFHAPEGNTLSLNLPYELKAGDTIYFIFSNEAWDVEGAYPNGQLNITLTK